jgi:hypothetical protein
MGTKVKTMVQKFKVVAVAVFTLALFPNFSNASMTPASYPWPWPWSDGCPIRWSDLSGSHGLVSNGNGDSFSIHLSRAGKRSMISVHVRRVDASGIHSDGRVDVYENQRRVVVPMMVYRPGDQPYAIQIRMGLYQTFQQPRKSEKCPPSRVKTVMTIDPLYTDAKANYMLEPSEQDYRSNPR